MTSSFGVTLVEGRARQVDERAWRRLYESDDDQDFDLYAAWKKYSQQSLLTIVAEAGDKLLAIAPMARTGGSWRVASCFAADRLAILLACEGREIPGLLDAKLDEMLLASRGVPDPKNLERGAAWHSGVLRWVRGRGLHACVIEPQASPRLRLSEWPQCRRKGLTANLRQASKVLISFGWVVMYKLTEPPAIRTELSTLRSWHASRWMSASSERWPLFEALVESAGPRVCRLSSLRLEGVPIAMRLDFCDGDTFYWCTPAFDPAYASCSPGLLLLDRMIEDAAGMRLSHFDFGRGDEPYRYRFGSQNLWLECIQLVGSPLRMAAGRALALLLDRGAS